MRGGLDEGDIHQHILVIDAPDWRDLAFTDALLDGVSAGRRPVTGAPWVRPAGRENYDRELCWSTLGRGLLAEAMAEGGTWQRVFDAARVSAEWPSAAPQVALLHQLDGLLMAGPR